MKGRRLIHTVRLCLIGSGRGRATYLRKHSVFASMGEGCTFMDRKVPLYPKLISIGNNVHLASNVMLVTHDITHIMLNRAAGTHTFREKLGCIRIKDNVFVGSGSVVLYDVQIGKNVIIGAGSIVTKDIPDNSVVAGVPAKVIGSFDNYVQNRLMEEASYSSLQSQKQEIPEALRDICWQRFRDSRSLEKEE